VRTLLVYAHPLDDSFIAAARDRALAGLRSAGHEVRVTDLYAERFDAALPLAEWSAHLADPATKTAVAGYIADLRWAESLVLVYPTWWGAQPAMLKGWMDRVWVKGVAWDVEPGAARITPQLTNIRRITAITSHGSTKIMNMLQGESGKRVVLRSLGLACKRFSRKTWCAFYGIDVASSAERAKFLDRVERVTGKR
jgi:putative NADPH-quinone reductase